MMARRSRPAHRAKSSSSATARIRIADFRTLVRMAKKWRNQAEIKPLKSFAIELIMAHVLRQQGNSASIEQRFRNFLLYIAQSGLKDEISFPENTAPFTIFSDPVVILDPVYSLNNVTSRISEAERKEIVAAADVRHGKPPILHLLKMTMRSGRKSSVLASRRRTEMSQTQTPPQLPTRSSTSKRSSAA